MARRKLHIRLYTLLKDRAGRALITVEGSTLLECLDALCAEVGEGTAELLYKSEGVVRSSYQICLNTRMLDPRRLGTEPFEDGDTLHIMPPIAGGGPRVGAVVLAAGHSSRMGRPKALLPLRGSTFLATIADRLAAAGIAPVAVVAGPAREAIEGLLPSGLWLLDQPDPDRGMLSSARIGVERVLGHEPPVDAVMICLVDHPEVTAGTYREMATRLAGHPDRIALPRFRGKHGHPLLLGRALAERLLELPDEATLRAIIKGHPESVVDVDVEDPGVGQDVDTPEDYRRLVGD